MKLDGMKCPNCGSNNTHAYRLEKATLWDDEFYNSMKKEFGENRLLSGSCENAIYSCNCNDCEKNFASMVLLENKVKKTISRKEIGEVMGLKVSEVDL